MQVEDERGALSPWSLAQPISIYQLIEATLAPGSALLGTSAGVSQSTSAVMAGTIGEPVVSRSVSATGACDWGYSGEIVPNNSVWCTGPSAYITNPHGVESAPPVKMSVGDIAGLTNISAIKAAIAGAYGLTRDSNGNTILGNGRWVKYDYDNRPVMVVNADGSGERYAYDHEGQRVRKQAFTTAQVVTSTTVYVGTIFEKTTTAGGVDTVKTLYAGSQRIGIRKGTGEVSYIHGDHLGSTSLMTDESGKVVRTTQYQPYGATYTTAGTRDTAWKFTGQKEDANTGLYYYNARYYDPQLGTFITPDTIVQNPNDPQSLNRYAYCRNNPIIYADPDGHFFFIAMAIGAIVGGTHGFNGTGFHLDSAIQGAVMGGVCSGFALAGSQLSFGLAANTLHWGQTASSLMSWGMGGGFANTAGYMMSGQPLTGEGFAKAFGQGAAIGMAMYGARELLFGSPKGFNVSDSTKADMKKIGMTDEQVSEVENNMNKTKSIWDRKTMSFEGDSKMSENVKNLSTNAADKEWFKYQHANQDYAFSYKPGEGNIHMEWNLGKNVTVHPDFYGTSSWGGIVSHNVFEYGIIGNGFYYGMVPSISDIQKK